MQRAGWKLLTESPLPTTKIRSEEGDKVRFSTLPTGQLTVINFWATWCQPCVEELPDLQQVHEMLEQKGVQVILINAQEDPRTTQKFLDALGVTIQSYYDTRGRLGGAFGVRGLPVSFLINSRGKVFARYVGLFPWANTQIMDVLSYPY